MFDTVMNKDDIFSKLKDFTIFQSIPEAQLQWLIAHSSYRTFEKGELYLKRGDSVDNLVVVLSGKISYSFEQGGVWQQTWEATAGDVVGALPYSRLKSTQGNGMIAESLKALFLHRDHFLPLICDCHELTQVLVWEMLDRSREFTQARQQNEKMLSLGKLSAGLAHELNNPAAAIVRSASQLKSHLGQVPENFKRVMLARYTPADVDVLNEWLFQKLSKPKLTLTMMERAAAEDDLRDWLDDHIVETTSEDAPEVFVDFSINISDLEHLRKEIPEKLDTALRWLESSLCTERFVKEIQDAATRIKNLVESVKEYSHLDKAHDKQPTNFHEGIRSTLVMLGFKLKHKKIRVQESFAENLPLVPAIPGEVNQVWTNLIDNAIDALPEGGTLQIVTKKEANVVRVNFIDNGNGIPEAVLAKIFDPFFTTKPVGEGTGLGLDIVKRIVESHQGEIKVHSTPGQTEFSLTFPLF
jgi:signal transduction histidine kinase